MRKHLGRLRARGRGLLLGRLGTYAGLLAGAVVTSFPFYWMITSGLKSNLEAVRFPPTLLPHAWEWSNYAAAWSAAPFARYFLNSAVFSLGVALCVTVTSALAAYAFAYLAFPGRDLLFTLFVATLLVPPEITLIPDFVLIRALGWYDTFAGLVLPLGASALSVFLLRQIFLGIPRELHEAARIDGCPPWLFFWRFVLPLGAPGLAVVGLLAFLRAWNDLLWPLIATSSDRMRTVQVGLLTFSQDVSTEYNLLMAAATMVVLPTVAAFLIAQRQLIEGIAATGVRG
ncbi:MAG: carbohydrate ABC transporter permease [Bacillota bacterium]|nr:carbohydrate ABC transporter permease [Bacillota bacterium]